MKCEHPWVNPYLMRINDFPGRIFSFDNFEDDSTRVCDLLTHSSGAYCEIGSGSGKHLIALGERNGDTCCFGFELRYKRAVRTIEKAEKLGCENIFVLRTDARQLQEIFPKNSLDGVYVNFPDPWAKTKQRKHRILSDDFLETSEILLKERGFLSVKTDHQEYFESFHAVAQRSGQFEIEEESRDLHNSEFAERNIVTEFESLFCGQQLPIYYLRLRRIY